MLDGSSWHDGGSPPSNVDSLRVDSQHLGWRQAPAMLLSKCSLGTGDRGIQHNGQDS
jgi:hypothetical protein